MKAGDYTVGNLAANGSRECPAVVLPLAGQEAVLLLKSSPVLLVNLMIAVPSPSPLQG